MFTGPHSKETKLKISKAMKGRRVSSQARLKISQALRGKKFSEEHRQNMSLAQIGKKHSKESRLKISQVQKGKKIPKKTRQRMSQARREKFRTDPEFRCKFLEQVRRMSRHSTKIERLIGEVLKKIGVESKPQHPFSGDRVMAIPDFYLPDHNLVIECDGDFWHSRVPQKRRDHIKNQLYRKLGLRVVRLKENRILVNPKKALLAGLGKIH